MDENINQEEQQLQKPKRSKLKVFFYVFGVIILIPVVTFILLNIFSRDIKEIDYDDLKLSKVELPDESQNAYFDLVAAAEKIQIEDTAKVRDIVDGAIWDEEYAERLLEVNREALILFNQASEKNFYQNPELVNPENFSPDTILPPLNKIRDLARIKSIESIYNKKIGKEELALENTLQILNISNLMIDSQSSLIEYLVALEYRRLGLERFNDVIKDTSLDKEVISTYHKQLGELASIREGAKQAIKLDYYYPNFYIFITKYKDELFRERLPEIMIFASRFPYYYKPNKTFNYFTENIRKTISYIDTSCNTPVPEFNKYFPENANNFKLLVTENIVGRAIHAMTDASLSGIKDRICEQEALLEEIQINITALNEN